ncbi:MAG: TerB family tellurite resistance protein [Burkholderiaceae bacterium]|nr:TerB family tellurite resistance protein [Burkholderiaceae bacterium]
MRCYPIDSPQAAARIVALAAMADGHLDRRELDLLERIGVHDQLGMTRADWHDVLHALCEDLLACTRLTWGDACTVDPLTLQHLLAEVHDPALRERVLALSLAAAEADAQVTEGEALVLAAAVERWGLQHRMFERPPLQATA